MILVQMKTLSNYHKMNPHGHVINASCKGFSSFIPSHSVILKGCGGVKEFNLRLIKGTSG